MTSAIKRTNYKRMVSGTNRIAIKCGTLALDPDRQITREKTHRIVRRSNHIFKRFSKFHLDGAGTRDDRN